eukprot:1142289-Pelagomonas_calceolata.AAC.1
MLHDLVEGTTLAGGARCCAKQHHGVSPHNINAFLKEQVWPWPTGLGRAPGQEDLPGSRSRRKTYLAPGQEDLPLAVWLLCL